MYVEEILDFFKSFLKKVNCVKNVNKPEAYLMCPKPLTVKKSLWFWDWFSFYF